MEMQSERMSNSAKHAITHVEHCITTDANNSNICLTKFYRNNRVVERK
jgi:hypothetical protein